jgi:hypothetical protein
MTLVRAGLIAALASITLQTAALAGPTGNCTGSNVSRNANTTATPTTTNTTTFRPAVTTGNGGISFSGGIRK